MCVWSVSVAKRAAVSLLPCLAVARRAPDRRGKRSTEVLCSRHSQQCGVSPMACTKLCSSAAIIARTHCVEVCFVALH